ncbi:hypothetical protein JCM14469_03820 [Desulfatiferula olefinivorans]
MSVTQTGKQGRSYFAFSAGLLFAALILFPSQTFAFGSWNQETTARELCFLYTLSKDWQQTLDISERPDQYQEKNRILGPHPDKKDVHIYFAGCAVAHAFISYMLPPRYSKIWQATWIGIQSSVTEQNDDNGLHQGMEMAYTISFSVPF